MRCTDGWEAGARGSRERSWKLESRRGGSVGGKREGEEGGGGSGNRVPMPHYTDRLSFSRSRGSYFRVAGLRGWEPPPERVPADPSRSAIAIGGRYPPLLLRYPPPALLLFRVISTFRYALHKRDFKTARDRSRAAHRKGFSITRFDFVCNLRNVAIIFEVKFLRTICATLTYISRTSSMHIKIFNYLLRLAEINHDTSRGYFIKKLYE